MNNSNLRTCFGPKTKVCPFEELSVPAMPEQTDSYMPIRHDVFAEMVKLQLNAAGMTITQEIHALWRGGDRYFGIMQVAHNLISREDMSLVVAVRNSYDKSLPASIAAGNSVFVCDNLVLASEIVLGRKHTKFMMDDLHDKIVSAMATLERHWAHHFARIEAYKSFGLSDLQAHDLIVQAYREGGIGKVLVADTIDQWHTPNHPEFRDRNLWSLHNAFTEVIKGRADEIQSRSDILHGILDAIAGVPPVNVKVVSLSRGQLNAGEND